MLKIQLADFTFLYLFSWLFSISLENWINKTIFSQKNYQSSHLSNLTKNCCLESKNTSSVFQTVRMSYFVTSFRCKVCSCVPHKHLQLLHIRLNRYTYYINFTRWFSAVGLPGFGTLEYGRSRSVLNSVCCTTTKCTEKQNVGIE